VVAGWLVRSRSLLSIHIGDIDVVIKVFGDCRSILRLPLKCGEKKNQIPVDSEMKRYKNSV